MCGKQTIPWKVVDHAMGVMPLPSRDRAAIAPTFAIDGRFQSLANFKILPMRSRLGQIGASLRLMIIVLESSASEPKDKVIGALTIYERVQSAPPRFDYSFSTHELYIAATKSWFTHFRHLAFLALAAMPQLTPALSSWAIDWNQTHIQDGGLQESIFVKMYMVAALEDYVEGDAGLCVASRGSMCSAEIRMDNFKLWELPLRGIRLAMIASRALPFRPAWSQSVLDQPKARLKFDEAVLRSMVATSVRWLIFLHATAEPLTCKDVVSQLCYIISIGYDSTPAGFYDDMQEGYQIARSLRSVAGRDDYRLSQAAFQRKYRPVDRLYSKTKYQTLLVADNGKIGLCFAAIDVEKGDEIVLLAGSDFPVILRPVLGEEKYYRFIGPAVVHGVMEGEAWPVDVDVDRLPLFILV